MQAYRVAIGLQSRSSAEESQLTQLDNPKYSINDLLTRTLLVKVSRMAPVPESQHRFDL